jgi:thioesterase domain-containing protein/acyl carrier protein
MTTSGRSGGHPLVQDIVGLLANVVPIFSTMNSDRGVIDWLRTFQKTAVKSMGLDLWSINEVQDKARAVGKDFVVDSLFTFENFPWKDIVGKEMKITGFSSGITSNYPVTMIAVPGDRLSFHLHYDENVLSSAMAKELLDLYKTILLALTKAETINKLPASSIKIAAQKTDNSSKEIILPQSGMEVTLLRIWQKVLAIDNISVTDNYFAIGGKSIQALQVFSMLQSETGQNIAPATLLQYPSIRTLAEHISEGSETNWSSLVPLQVSGKGGPLFTIHAGGAHVFVYRALAEALKDQRPVYAIQPFGLDGSGQHNETIEDMTLAYLEEIKKVQPSGPVHILGYCFSAAIAAEMAFHLRKEGRRFSILIVDSAPGLTYGRPKLPLGGRIKKLMGMFTEGQWARVREVIEGKWDGFKAKYLTKYESEQMRTFRQVEGILGKVYTAYNWKEYDGPIHLMRSAEFIGRSDKDIHVEEWDRLVGKNLHIHPVEGQHKTLFDPPHVTQLAEVLQDIMSSTEDGKTV